MLGQQVKNEGQTCESNPNLGYPCNHVMLSCCDGEDHLISPELKRQPEPLSTVTPEKCKSIIIVYNRERQLFFPTGHLGLLWRAEPIG